MVIGRLNGGLGNQLFQYAAGKSLALHHQTPFLLDISQFKRSKLHELEVPRDFELYHFNGVHDEVINLREKLSEPEFRFLKRNFVQKVFQKNNTATYIDPFYHFDPDFFNNPKDILLNVQCQSEKYFYNIRNEIRKSLVIKEELIKKVKSYIPVDRDTISVHVRRGDYLRKKIILEWHGVMGKEYYQNALRKISESISNFKVYYFSDDPAWIEKELLPIMPGEIVSSNLSTNHIEDFYLMSQCRHQIIANSSFSWWAAWLNNNPDKIVIAPKNWFNKGPKDTQDLIPEGWIRI